MSMYNLMMGVNPYAPVLLATLGFSNPAEEIPRIRDCYVDNDNNIVVFTRTGGGNREDYAAENDSLRARPGFLRDEDWSTDTTFAKWIYAPPEGVADLVRQLADAGARMDPTEKFEALMADIRRENPGPTGRAAMERARPLMEQLRAAIQSGEGGGVIVVSSGQPPEFDNKRKD